MKKKYLAKKLDLLSFSDFKIIQPKSEKNLGSLFQLLNDKNFPKNRQRDEQNKGNPIELSIKRGRFKSSTNNLRKFAFSSKKQKIPNTHDPVNDLSKIFKF